MRPSIRNHYLPQFYLKFFLNNDSSVFWVYYKGKSEPIPQTPINTGVEKNLYNIKMEDGTINDSIERDVLSPLEGEASSIIENLVKSKSKIKDENIPILSSFLSFMATRIPRQIEMIREMGTAFVEYIRSDLAKNPDEIENILKKLKASNKIDKNLTTVEAQKILSEDPDKFNVSMNKKAATGLSLISTFDIFDELIHMNWCLYRSPSKINFITSDCPFVSFVLDDKGNALFGSGIKLQNVQITFPISPKKCLYIDRKNKKRYRAVNKKVVKEINKRTAWTAERFLISHIRMKSVQKLCDWSSSTLNQKKIDKNQLKKEFEKQVEIKI
jgi:hypothetical protein